jgi:hypothetical protein
MHRAKDVKVRMVLGQAGRVYGMKIRGERSQSGKGGGELRGQGMGEIAWGVGFEKYRRGTSATQKARAKRQGARECATHQNVRP